MKTKNKILLYRIILVLSIIIFGREVLLLGNKGVWSLIVSLISIYTMIGSTIKLCNFNPVFKKTTLSSIDLLFFLP